MRIHEDSFEQFEVEEDIQPSQRGAVGWNLLTILVLLALAGLWVWFALIFLNPQAVYNPYPPPTLPVPLVLAASTQSAVSSAPVWTPTLVDDAQPTLTPPPEADIPAPIGGGVIAEPAEPQLPDAKYPYELQSLPAGISAAVLHPDRTCNWMGIGGQVVDLRGAGITGITVQVGGSLGDISINLYPSLTGTALKYGPAGYEITLAE
ncbi:MAG: hypothetical protein U1B80_05405, partial [Anaerolineaceae bacterium]|nr:hypothetical protein [Anaerolineaceae bacterium]